MITHLCSFVLCSSGDDPSNPVAPPRKGRDDSAEKKTLYEKLPAGLKQECLVRTKVGTDEQVMHDRQELTRSKTPAELGQIHGFSDLPIPQILPRKKKEDAATKAAAANEESEDGGGEKKKEGIYGTLPKALTEAQCRVRSRTEDPDMQKERAEVVKNKTVSELSQITSFSDFPVPFARGPRPVERKKRFREKQRSQSAKNIYEQLQGSLPTTRLLVKAKVEDAGLVEDKRRLVASKSVGELSQIHSISDFPVPHTLTRMFSKSKTDLASAEAGSKGYKHRSFLVAHVLNRLLFRTSTSNLSKQNIYETLPKALKSEMMVRSRMEDPDVSEQRRAVTQTKSVSELSQIHGFGDIPIPGNFERMFQSKPKEPEEKQPKDVER